MFRTPLFRRTLAGTSRSSKASSAGTNRWGARVALRTMERILRFMVIAWEAVSWVGKGDVPSPFTSPGSTFDLDTAQEIKPPEGEGWAVFGPTASGEGGRQRGQGDGVVDLLLALAVDDGFHDQV